MDNNQNNTTNTPISDAADVKAEEKVFSPTAVPEPPSAPSGVGPIPVRPVNPTPQQMPASEEVKPEVKPVQDKVVSPLLNSDELISAYIGPNYDKIMKRPFNFAAFVFGSLYYFYRKMNTGGIIILIINALIAYFLKGYTICYALVGVHVLIGFVTNRIYSNGAIRKINKLLIDYGRNPLIEVKGMCRVYGGVSKARVFTAIVWLILLVFPVIVISALILGVDKVTEYIEDLKQKIPEVKAPDIELPDLSLESKYEGGVIVSKESKLLDQFNIGIPSVFTPNENNNEYELDYTYKSNKKKLGNCSVSLRGVNGYINPKTLINQMHDYYLDKNPTNVIEQHVNRIIWYTFSYETNDANVYVYTCVKGRIVYLFTYIDEKDSSNLCHSYRAQILNEIVLK